MEEERIEFRMPRIRDLTLGEEDVPGRAEPGVADLVLVARGQLEEALAEIEEVPELPEDAGAGMLFVPFGRGYLGIPFCASHDPEVTCWPMKGGLDDNPLAWVCVCEGPRQGKDPSTGWTLPKPAGRCLLGPTVQGGVLQLGCVPWTCAGTCRLVKTGPKGGPYQLSCSCV